MNYTAGYLKDVIAVFAFAIGLIYISIYKTFPYPALLFFFLSGLLVDFTFSVHPDFHNEPVDPSRPATQVVFALPFLIIIVLYVLFRR